MASRYFKIFLVISVTLFMYLVCISRTILQNKFLKNVPFTYVQKEIFDTGVENVSVENDSQVLSSEEKSDLPILMVNSDSNIMDDSVVQKLPINTNSNMKYILQWTSANNVPFVYMGKGQEGFTSRNCPYTNCFVTSNRNQLSSITKFDVIAFSGPQLRSYGTNLLPKERSLHQKYVFATIESSHYYPVCNTQFNNFFNWTWTFRLDSDVRWGYMLIKDNNGHIVGPNKVMHWLNLEDMDPVSNEIKEKLKKKRKAAAWLVSNCFDKAGRLSVAKQLGKALEKYNLVLDIYGKCGNLKCPTTDIPDCEKMLAENYFFYLSFENSFSEDYVTEKLLKALQNDMIPIVYGGANYTRFMPDGIYLNAKEIPVDELAARMNELINDPEQYANFFKWKNHYVYQSLHDSPWTDEYCRFCITLNNEEKVRRTSVIENFKDWWNDPSYC